MGKWRSFVDEILARCYHNYATESTPGDGLWNGDGKSDRLREAVQKRCQTKQCLPKARIDRSKERKITNARKKTSSRRVILVIESSGGSDRD